MLALDLDLAVDRCSLSSSDQISTLGDAISEKCSRFCISGFLHSSGMLHCSCVFFSS